MATMPLIDELDRCKTALQVVAEMQSDELATLLELLIERLDDAIGQVQAHIRQCTCQARLRDLGATVPVCRGALTVCQRPSPIPPEP